jgi:hypothetical protein
MAPLYPLGTKSANGNYAIGKNGHTLPLENVPLLGSLLRSSPSWQANNGGGSSGGSGNSWNGNNPSPPPQQSGQSFAWQFPQYSQTWAFTPPAPSAFRLPPAFDPKSKTGYVEPKTSTTKPKTTKTASTPFTQSGSSGAFDLAALFGKYR